MSEKVKKKFPISIGSLKKQSEKIETYFVPYKPDFQKDYPLVFTDEHYATVSGRIARANAQPSDVAMRNRQATQTAALVQLSGKFDKLYVKLNANVQQAFPDQKAIRREFGIKRKTEITYTLKKLHEFSADIISVWGKYGAAMLAAGCPPGLIGEFEAFLAELIDLSNQQGLAIDTRHYSADERMENYNAVWFALVGFENYAKAIYGDGSPKAGMFHIDRRRGKKSDSDSGTTPKPAKVSRKKKVPPVSSSSEGDVVGVGENI